MAKLKEKIEELIAPIVRAMGYELWGIELLGAGEHSILRVYIDIAQELQNAGHDGISIDDCTKVSHQISAILDVEDPIASRYSLEVSSPGLDRLLFTLEHFRRFIGSKVHLVLLTPYQGRRKFAGQIKDVIADEIVLMVDDVLFAIPFAKIQKAKLSNF